MRDAERDLIFNEYKDRKGELISGIVRRFEKGNNIIVDLGRTEGVLPFREQTPRETYRPGDRIVALRARTSIAKRAARRSSCRAPIRQLVEKLFETEVPEIYEGIVKIVAVRARARRSLEDRRHEPRRGRRSGRRVRRDEGLARAGRRARAPRRKDRHRPVRSRSRALRHAPPSSRPRSTRSSSTRRDGRMELVVPDEKLSLAIGRKGQNVRLAAQLTGWKLDIISESKFKQMEEEAISRSSSSVRSTRPSPRRCTDSASVPSKRSPKQA